MGSLSLLEDKKMFTKLEAVGYNKNLAWVSVALPRPQHEHQLSGGLRWARATTC